MFIMGAIHSNMYSDPYLVFDSQDFSLNQGSGCNLQPVLDVPMCRCYAAANLILVLRQQCLECTCWSLFVYKLLSYGCEVLSLSN